jgi:two-component system nitrogen regulation sensor histidine kinase GlnL
MSETGANLQKSVVPLSDNAPVALVALSADERVRDTNPAAEALFGLSHRGMLGKRLDEITVGSGDLLSLIAHVRQTQADTASPEVLLKPAGLVDERLVTVRVRWFASGEMVLAVSAAMTQQPEDPIAGVASFGRILGHEIKNPLAGISGAAQLMLRRASGEDRELLTLIREESARIERLVNRLSAFELFSAPQMAPVNIHRVLDRVLASEEAAFDGQLRFQRAYDPSLPDIIADSDHLHEAIQNVVRNGIEAALSNTAKAAPVILLRTAFESRFATRGAGKARRLKRALRIDVIDSGPGMDSERLSRAFDAFSSTKSAGRGLGLTVVKEVISAHGGKVQIKNSGEGAVVSIFLPLGEGQVK